VTSEGGLWVSDGDRSGQNVCRELCLFPRWRWQDAHFAPGELISHGKGSGTDIMRSY